MSVDVAYVTDTSRWEGWKREYVFGAFCIFPPDDVIGQIDALRETYDRCPPRSARRT